MPTIDLSQLPAPLVVESLDFDSLFALRKEDLSPYIRLTNKPQCA